MFRKKRSSSTDKEKSLSPKDILAREIEAMEKGEEATFKLGDMYLRPFLIIQCGSGTGRKYEVYQDTKGADGKPSGRRGSFWKTSNPKEIADWIDQRGGHRYEV